MQSKKRKSKVGKLKLSKNDENKPTNDLINDVSLSEPSLQSSNKTTFELNTTEVNDEATTLDENITIIKFINKI